MDRSFAGDWRILEATYRANPPEVLETAAALVIDARQNLTIGMRMGHALALSAAFSLHLLLGNATAVTMGADTLEDSLRSYGRDDVAILFDFRPYNDVMTRVAEVLAARRVRRIAVSDSDLAPICRGADVVLRTATEMEVGAGRSLVGGLALINALTALVWELEPDRCRASMQQTMALRMTALAARSRRGGDRSARASATCGLDRGHDGEDPAAGPAAGLLQAWTAERGDGSWSNV